MIASGAHVIALPPKIVRIYRARRAFPRDMNIRRCGPGKQGQLKKGEILWLVVQSLFG